MLSLQHLAYEEAELKEGRAIATMREICLFPIFKSEFDPTAYFKESWVIKFPPNVSEDSHTIVVNLRHE